MSARRRVVVLIDARRSVEMIDQTLSSIREREPVELLVALDTDAVSEPATTRTVRERGGATMHVALDAGPAELVVAGAAATDAGYLLALTAGDLVSAGMLRTMADRLDRHAELDLCFGDFVVYEGDRFQVREVAGPPIGFELPAMFRREALPEAAGAPERDRGSYLGARVITLMRRGEVGEGSAAGAADAAKFRVLVEAAIDPVRSAGPEAGARIAVLIPCFNDGSYVVAAAHSVREPEPVEIWVIDDASTEPETAEALQRLKDEGFLVLYQRTNSGPSAARNVAMATTAAPYVFALDADDLSVRGSLSRLADTLDSDPELAAAYGDIEELTATGTVVRAAPPSLDPFRVAFVNEMPLGALYRKSAIEPIGGWSDPYEHLLGYEDWDLWMSLAEQGAQAVRVDDELVAYRYRLHASRMTAATKQLHPTLYRALRARHRVLFDRLTEHRRASSLGPVRKALYPLIYGGRRRYAFERRIKRGLDRLGIWTRRR